MYLNDFKFSEMPPSLLDFDIENLSELGDDTLLNNIHRTIKYLIDCVYGCFLA